jgi:hypothetical protein
VKGGRAKLTKAQIGRCGELLVQYRLLKYGIESAQMTTDTGVDLVAFISEFQRAITIQVKANERSKPAGGKGRPALDWWLKRDKHADWIAICELESEQVWLFTREEFLLSAQQQPEGRLHFYMYVGEGHIPRKTMCHVRDFNEHLVEEKLTELLNSDSSKLTQIVNQVPPSS